MLFDAAVKFVQHQRGDNADDKADDVDQRGAEVEREALEGDDDQGCCDHYSDDTMEHGRIVIFQQASNGFGQQCHSQQSADASGNQDAEIQIANTGNKGRV